MRSMLLISCALGLTACATSNSANSVGGFRLHIEDAVPVADSDDAGSDFVPVVDAASPSPISSAAAQEEVETDIEVLSVLVGQRWLYAGEADDLGVDRPFFFGVEFDGHDSETGHGYEVGYGWSDEDNMGGAVGLTFQELYAGYRFTMNADDWLQPYFGLGLTYLHANVDGAGTGDDDDDAYGGYARVGLATSFDRLRFALDYRHTWANVHIAGTDVDGDYDQLALSAGWQF